MASRSSHHETSVLAQTIHDLGDSTRMDLCVYVSHRPLEKSPSQRAQFLLDDWNRKAPVEEGKFRFLVYLNLRASKFAIVSDLGTSSYLTEKDWLKLRKNLENELATTNWERAISRTLALLTQIMLFRLSQEELQNSAEPEQMAQSR